MESILFKVLIDGTTVADHMSVEHAMIFIENLFNHYHNDTEMLVSIQRMEHEQEQTECKGTWIDNGNGTISCSECSTWFPKEREPYLCLCGHCGAKMHDYK